MKKRVGFPWDALGPAPGTGASCWRRCTRPLFPVWHTRRARCRQPAYHHVDDAGGAVGDADVVIGGQGPRVLQLHAGAVRSARRRLLGTNAAVARPVSQAHGSSAACTFTFHPHPPEQCIGGCLWASLRLPPRQARGAASPPSRPAAHRNHEVSRALHRLQHAADVGVGCAQLHGGESGRRACVFGRGWRPASPMEAGVERTTGRQCLPACHAHGCTPLSPLSFRPVHPHPQPHPDLHPHPHQMNT